MITTLNLNFYFRIMELQILTTPSASLGSGRLKGLTLQIFILEAKD
jgi:hypothetical protein